MGRASSARKRCSRTNVVSSAIRPPASCPLATNPSTPMAAPVRACSRQLASSSVVIPFSRSSCTCALSSCGRPDVRITVFRCSGVAVITRSNNSGVSPPSLIPKGACRHCIAFAAACESRIYSKSSSANSPARWVAKAMEGFSKPGLIVTIWNDCDIALLPPSQSASGRNKTHFSDPIDEEPDNHCRGE